MRSQSPLPADSKDWSDRKYRVVFRYCPQHDDELSINEGDLITVLHEVEEGWWKGLLNGQVGMFPSNFVEEIEEATPCTKNNELNGNGINTSIKDNSRNSDSPDGNRSPKIVGSPNSAFHPIQPKREERGSKRNSIGDTPPANKVDKVHVPKGSKRNSNSVEPDRQSYEKDKITISIGEEVNRRDKESLTKVPSSSLEPTPPQLPPKPVRELARVVFPYSADHDDELDLYDGEIITVLCKELEDKGWWKGEINSRVGVFPDNFVELINADEVVKPPRPEKRPTALPKPKLPPEAQTTQKKETAPSPVSHALKKPHMSKKKVESVPDTVALDRPRSSADGNELLSLDREHHLIHQTQTRPKGPSNRRPPSQTFLDEKKTSLSEDEELSSLAEEIVTPKREATANNSTTSSEVPWMKELKANQKKKKLSGTPSLEPSQNNSTSSSVDGSPATAVSRRCRSDSIPTTKTRTSTGSMISTKCDVSPPAAPIKAPVSTNGFKDDPPVGQADYDGILNKLRAEFSTQIKKLEERLVEQQQRHNRQLLMFMDELGDERQKIACLQIDIDRLTKLTSSDANV